MKKHGRLLLLAIVVVVAGSLLVASPPQQEDNLQGTWRVVKFAHHKKTFEENFKEIKIELVIKGDQFTISGRFPDHELNAQGTVKSDAQAKLKTIDFNVVDGSKRLCIYELDKDKLKIGGLNGAKRPTRFDEEVDVWFFERQAP